MSQLEYNKALYVPLAEADPEVQKLIEEESRRQRDSLELIASENLTYRAVIEANGTILMNKVTEGLPGARYYGGHEYIDQLEELCRQRALAVFRLDPEVWGVNVQPYSGSTTNFAAMTAILQPQDRFMGLALSDGGHLSHGFYTAQRKVTAAAVYFQSLPYGLDAKTELIDYDGLAAQARSFKPRLIICGASAYPRDWDYARIRKIADEHNAFVLADLAHTCGLIAGQQLKDPFEYCDLVCTTTNKTLRGPQAGMIFYRKNGKWGRELEEKVHNAIFPGVQGACHDNTIAAIAVGLKQACQPWWQQYAEQVVKNARVLAEELINYGYKIQTGGTDNHTILWDVRPLGLTGSKVEKLCDLVGISINKNTVTGDSSGRTPGGVRLGTSTLTSRDVVESGMRRVASFLHRAAQVSLVLQKEAGSKLLKDFVRVGTVETEGAIGAQLVRELKRDVAEFVKDLPIPGGPERSVYRNGLPN